MKKFILSAAVLTMSICAFAQDGGNTAMGYESNNYQSLAERVFNLEKKSDAFNVYFNYAASAQLAGVDNDWSSRFAAKQFRLEIKGNLTDRLYYRLRHRMNKGNAAQSLDNFAKATDIMFLGYKLTPKLDIVAGKMCQMWGGFEFDENPMYIYQYSDIIDCMDNFMTGVMLSYKPIPSQEFALNVTNVNNGSFADTWGANPYRIYDLTIDPELISAASHPLTVILNWNGNFMDDMIQTRWAWGYQNQAKNMGGQMLTLGQKLNLPTFQWYLDYMGEWDKMDRLGIVTSDLSSLLGSRYAGDVYYQSFITKANWQFAPRWNLMLKGTYENASMRKIESLKNYRTSIGYDAAIEFYPDKSQDLRFFLAYIGHHYGFNEASGLSNYNTNRIELGFMYRIKCY